MTNDDLLTEYSQLSVEIGRHREALAALEIRCQQLKAQLTKLLNGEQFDLIIDGIDDPDFREVGEPDGR